MKVVYRKLKENEICYELFLPFHRHQEVTKCYRKENGNWVIKDIAFTEEWKEEEKRYLVNCLLQTIKKKGSVIGAFYDKVLIGFASVENIRFGSERQYIELSSLHVSEEYRGKGIGKKLFEKVCKSAQWLGAKKLYISSYSAIETQAFYKAVGCVEAMEYNQDSVEKEPCDCQLEYKITGIKIYRRIFILIGAAVGGIYGNLVLHRTILGIFAGLCFGVLLNILLEEKKS